MEATTTQRVNFLGIQSGKSKVVLKNLMCFSHGEGHPRVQTEAWRKKKKNIQTGVNITQ